MPGKHSQEKLAARRLRAIQRRCIRSNTVWTDAVEAIAVKDVLFETDPWKDAVHDAAGNEKFAGDPWGSFSREKAFRSGLDPDTPPFVPCFPPPPSGGVLSDSDLEGLHSQLRNAHALIQQQNDTIANLSAQLEVRYYPAGVGPPCTVDVHRFEKLENTVNELAKSLGAAVQSSIDQRTLPLEQRLTNLETSAIHMNKEPKTADDRVSSLRQEMNLKFDILQTSINDQCELLLQTCLSHSETQSKDRARVVTGKNIDVLTRIRDRFNEKVSSLTSKLEDIAQLKRQADFPGPLGDRFFGAPALAYITSSGGYVAQTVSDEGDCDAHSRVREMSCREFLVVASQIKLRLPHRVSRRPLLRICDRGSSPALLLSQRIKALSSSPMTVTMSRLVGDMQALADDMAFGELSDDEEKVHALCDRADNFLPRSSKECPCVQASYSDQIETITCSRIAMM